MHIYLSIFILLTIFVYLVGTAFLKKKEIPQLQFGIVTKIILILSLLAAILIIKDLIFTVVCLFCTIPQVLDINSKIKRYRELKLEIDR